MGQGDSPLSAAGVAQAERLAVRFAGADLAAIYSSDLGRARATAAAIADRRGEIVREDARLRERHVGIFQGLTVAEARARFPAERAAYESGDREFVVPGGESPAQHLARVRACLDELAARHAGGTVLAVTHGGSLIVWFEFVLGLGPGVRYRRPNAGVNVFTRDDAGRWALETWGDVSHLAGLPTRDDPIR